MRNISRTHTIIAVIFFVSIYVSCLGYVFKLDCFQGLHENRTYSRLPALSLEYSKLMAYPDEFEDNFNDHFGLRQIYIFLNNYMKYMYLGLSGSPKVDIGKDQWLFFAITFTGYHDSSVFTPDLLDRWKLSLEIKKAWFLKQGIRYYFTIIPNKNTIYPEYVPQKYARKETSTPIDQLTEHLRQNSTVPFVDVKETLLNAKNGTYTLYYKTDTHINYYGAFHIANRLLQAVSQEVPACIPLNISEFTVTSKTGRGGDLSRMLGLDSLITDQWIIFEPNSSWSFTSPTPEEIFYPDTIFVKNADDPVIETRNISQALPNALVFRDSCGHGVLPFLSERFSYIRYIWEHLGILIPIETLIEEVQPDVVIEEVVERNLIFDKPQLPPDISKALYHLADKEIMRLDGMDCSRIFTQHKKANFLLAKQNFIIPLGSFAENSAEFIVLEFDIQSEEPSEMVISHRTKRVSEYNENTAYHINLNKGRNTVYVTLLSTCITGDVKCNFSSDLKNYTVHSVAAKRLGVDALY
ncbi:MAG: hypothetical protein C4541_09620 [Candidatus Auribacter fodinae]|uniref:AlgX/AlgJ SGNH hydrolase-like domain-containing protein n=1 Tax=Candidatus Auribacter fodinae TaxID=2093366 RepID=A0A3A4QYH5_9BACT|nr:MAG: hypothetical protein C4541_09620 [Candidatus Auribacter fodinae]